MATVGTGQRGSVVWTAGSEIPDEWIAIADATNINIQRAMYTYLPDNATKNADIQVPGQITSITADIQGTVDLDVNIELLSWTTIGSTVAAQIILKLSSARTYTFDAFLTNLSIQRENRSLTRWSGTIIWDGVSTIVET